MRKVLFFNKKNLLISQEAICVAGDIEISNLNEFVSDFLEVVEFTL